MTPTIPTDPATTAVPAPRFQIDPAVPTQLVSWVQREHHEPLRDLVLELGAALHLGYRPVPQVDAALALLDTTPARNPFWLFHRLALRRTLVLIRWGLEKAAAGSRVCLSLASSRSVEVLVVEN